MLRRGSVRFVVPVCLFATAAFGADKSPAPLLKTYDAPIETVYGAVVQVATADYNLKSAVKEGHSASFFTGGRYSMVLSAICQDAGDGETSVSLSIAEAVGNPQVFGVGKAKEKEAARFWSELDKAVQMMLRAASSPLAQGNAANGVQNTQIAIMSAPSGADILIDGKFSGDTPSTVPIAAGDHTVRIEMDGFEPWQKSISVAKGAQLSLRATLKPRK